PTRSTLFPYTTLFRSLVRFPGREVFVFVDSGIRRTNFGVIDYCVPLVVSMVAGAIPVDCSITQPTEAQSVKGVDGTRVENLDERSEEHTSELQSLAYL